MSGLWSYKEVYLPSASWGTCFPLKSLLTSALRPCSLLQWVLRMFSFILVPVIQTHCAVSVYEPWLMYWTPFARNKSYEHWKFPSFTITKWRHLHGNYNTQRQCINSSFFYGFRRKPKLEGRFLFTPGKYHILYEALLSTTPSDNEIEHHVTWAKQKALSFNEPPPSPNQYICFASVNHWDSMSDRVWFRFCSTSRGGPGNCWSCLVFLGMSGPSAAYYANASPRHVDACCQGFKLRWLLLQVG